LDIVFFLPQQPYSGKNQNQPENVEHGMVALQQYGTGHDKSAAHEDSANNAPKQNPMLLRLGHGKVTEDEDKNKNVIHRQGPLDKVTGDEFERFGRAILIVNKNAKKHGQTGPDHAPDQGLFELHLMRPAMKNPQVDRQQQRNQATKAQPKWGRGHG